jgi:hypothetical protein
MLPDNGIIKWPRAVEKAPMKTAKEGRMEISYMKGPSSIATNHVSIFSNGMSRVWDAPENIRLP